MKNKIESIYLNIFVKIFKINTNFQKKLLLKKIDITLNDYKNWDSIQHINLLTKVEKKFKIKINSKNSNKFNSYASGLKYLKKIKNLYNQI